MTEGLFVVVLIASCFQYMVKGQIVNITTPDDKAYTFLSNHGYGIGTSASVVFSVRPNACGTAYILLAESTIKSGYFLTVMIYTKKIQVHNFGGIPKSTFDSSDTLLVCGQFTPFKISWTADRVTTYRMDTNSWIEVYTYQNTNHGVVSEVGIKTVDETGDWTFGEESTTTATTPTTTAATTSTTAATTSTIAATTSTTAATTSTTAATTSTIAATTSTTAATTSTTAATTSTTTESTTAVLQEIISTLVTTGAAATTASTETILKPTTEEFPTQYLTMTSDNTAPVVTTEFPPSPTTTLTYEQGEGTTSTSPQGLCTCSCHVNSDTASLESLIAALRKELIVNKKETSIFKRSLISAPDDRTSSKSIGYVGVIILSCVFGGIVVLDLKYIIIIVQKSISLVKYSRGSSSKVSISSEAPLRSRADSWLPTA